MKEKRKTHWIWINKWSAADKEVPGLVLFRKKIHLLHEPKEGYIRISADSKYKLYINGQLTEMGPSRGAGRPTRMRVSI